MDFEDYTEEEIQRWLWLRAVEWCGFPAYLSQIFAPILFIFFPWWQVVLAILFVGLCWCSVRYWFVTATISNLACLAVVWLKWPVALGSSIYLFADHQPLAGVIAIIWPLVAALTTPPGKVGIIELKLARNIGYASSNAEG